jgi:hypothetical protein
MAAFDPQIARLATITRSSLARAFEEKTQSLWNDGVQQELRSWLSLGVTLDFYPSDPQHLETLTHVFGVRWDVDEFGDLFDQGSTVDKHRLHPYVQSALLLADHLHADSVACRLLSAIAFAPEDTWQELVVTQRQLVASLREARLESLMQMAHGNAWLFDGTVRVLHHLRAFHFWRDGVTAHFSEGEDSALAPSLVHAVTRLQQWRLNVSDADRLRRLEEVVDATEGITKTLLPSSRAYQQYHRRWLSPTRSSSGRWLVPNMVFGVRRPQTKA